MGKPMSKNLLKAGHELVVFDGAAAVEELVAAGAETAASPKDIAAQVDMVITMLPNSPQVKQVVLGEGGVIEGARGGAIVVDMSSIAPLVSREIAARLAEKGVEMLDAPVSGGEPKAIDGTLSVMVGGKQEVFDQCLPVFKAMAASVVLSGTSARATSPSWPTRSSSRSTSPPCPRRWCWPPRWGSTGIGLSGHSRRTGGQHGDGRQGAVDDGPKVQSRIPNQSAHQGPANVLDTSHELGVPLPLTASVMEIMQALKVDGKGDNDHGGLIQYYEKGANIEVKR